jgi:cytoskeletal protein CcmA (bactofilin family)
VSFQNRKVNARITLAEATLSGTCKGIIRGNSVKLQGMAVVEGEIYSKSLTIEREAQFEGVSRRLDKPVDAPSHAQATMPVKIPKAPAMTEAGPAGAGPEKLGA